MHEEAAHLSQDVLTRSPDVVAGATDAAQADAAGKTLFIQTYGCQMNVYDSERMADVLRPLGYRQVDRPDTANLVVLNTCHIREKATEKVYSEIGRLKAHKDVMAQKGDHMTIAIAGCVAQAEGEEIMRRAPAVDLVVGPQAYHKLPELIARAARASGERLETSFEAVEKFDALPTARAPEGPSAFLSVQEGCDKFCTFCVVPYTRGAEYSRNVDSIIAEARGLARQGVREITLLGQNVNAYHGQGPQLEGSNTWSLAQLVRHLAKIGGIERIRYTTSHPCDMGDDLIAAHGEVPELMPYLHLPVQSGSNKILKAMNRKHSVESYLETLAKVRQARPDIALASDFIVGFPGETEQDFEDTMELVRAVGYAGAFSFKYSRRPGTPAAEMYGQVDPEVADDRLQRLQALILDQQRAFNTSKVGQTFDVLFTGKGRNEGQILGRSPWLQSVHVQGPEALIGQLHRVRIIATASNSLTGELVISS
ncbi:tRNA-2-methylthio-N(6)-dimethylallyladenosine synthase [Candidatus Phycosocius bacilliformis]|uniref:tRNA-2-methylthio-N(6)-dimethylallyladenosine synthase n=1 Tax=Candidatus Phycosocius bacilliformis TaxID=1445552 RepID=A0A2P2EDQ3_9PROT|nr:tRNA (N6-isopentenyl adenosine(37)-C2)-methylthiotransferase MiaB [Candidatus Phycosocius bacilliformis]GBF59186.1 tRNA-2-methylthio-N(6)-dimethylallyladenosine synthase [Candidatus Phycosocius bacilliformis]